MTLGMAYVEFDVPGGTAGGIAGFYRDVFATGARVEGTAAHVSVGIGQELIFRDSDAAAEAYDGHHIQVYVANFSGPYRQLVERGLLTEETQPSTEYPLPAHRRPGHGQGAVRNRARGPQPAPSDACAAPGQSQPTPDQPQLRSRP